MIKVEPRDGDPARRKGPYFRGEESPIGPWWWTLKQATRELARTRRELARKLLADADILIET